MANHTLINAGVDTNCPAFAPYFVDLIVALFYGIKMHLCIAYTKPIGLRIPARKANCQPIWQCYVNSRNQRRFH